MDENHKYDSYTPFSEDTGVYSFLERCFDNQMPVDGVINQPQSTSSQILDGTIAYGPLAKNSEKKKYTDLKSDFSSVKILKYDQNCELNFPFPLKSQKIKYLSSDHDTMKSNEQEPSGHSYTVSMMDRNELLTDQSIICINNEMDPTIVQMINLKSYYPQTRVLLCVVQETDKLQKEKTCLITRIEYLQPYPLNIGFEKTEENLKIFILKSGGIHDNSQVSKMCVKVPKFYNRIEQYKNLIEYSNTILKFEPFWIISFDAHLTNTHDPISKQRIYLKLLLTLPDSDIYKSLLKEYFIGVHAG